MKFLPAKCRLWHGDGRLQQPAFTQARVPAEFLNDPAMDLQYDVHRKENDRLLHLANRRNTPARFFMT